MRTERRLAPRYPFLAMAEIIDEKENARKSSQVRDLSLQGCYVEMINPFPEGTNVMVEIYTENEFLETRAKVAYFEPKQGMGLRSMKCRSISRRFEEMAAAGQGSESELILPAATLRRAPCGLRPRTGLCATLRRRAAPLKIACGRQACL